jgi:hypothetical protein
MDIRKKELMELVLYLGGRPASLYAMEPANLMLNLGRWSQLVVDMS